MMSPRRREECRKAMEEEKRIVEIGSLEDPIAYSYPYYRGTKIALFTPISEFGKVYHCAECDYLTKSFTLFSIHALRHIFGVEKNNTREKPYLRDWVDTNYGLPEDEEQ